MTDGSSAVALRFEILGPVRAYRGAEPVDLGPLRQQAVLAVLLLHAGEPVPVDRIVDALWSGDPPANGIDIVQRYVGALRRALDPERTSLIALTPGGYVLRAGEGAVDAGLFRAALARARTARQVGNPGVVKDEAGHALGLRRGEPLAGLTGPVFGSARARLDEEHAAAAELLADSGLADSGLADSGLADSGLADSGLAEPVLAEPVSPEPFYPEPADPWAGHQLFPPSPI
jgi:DNA-binding SARP family transcriptional activator